jgi:DNA end-binding protein Ku
MPHAIWRGTISFGLVTIPVSLMPAEQPRELAFHLLDDRDQSPIHNVRTNEGTGKEVAWEHVVKGFEVSRGRYVVVSDDDLREANVEATQTIDVLAAVCADEIPPELLSAPYYLQPEKAGRKAYLLLREALTCAKRVALAKIVIRTRQHLAALIPHGDLLLLEILRYPYELRDVSELDLPGRDAAAVKSAGVTKAESDLAEQLVATISKPFDPGAAEYRDTYRDDLLALIERKAAGVAAPAPEAAAPAAKAGEVVDIVALLKRSLDEAKRKKA